MDHATQYKILWAVVALLALAVGVLLYVVLAPRAAGPASLGPGGAHDFAVGGETVEILGAVTSNQDGVLTLDTAAAKGYLAPELIKKLPKIAHVRIDGATQVGKLGAPKAIEVFNRELEDYNEKVRSLLAEAQKNKQELLTLLMPLGFVLEPLAAAQIQLGSIVRAHALPTTGDSYLALRLFVDATVPSTTESPPQP